MMDDREFPISCGSVCGLVSAATGGLFLNWVALIAFVALVDPQFLYDIYFIATRLPGELWAWFSRSVWAQLWYAICWFVSYWWATIIFRTEKLFPPDLATLEKSCGEELDTKCEQDLEAQVKWSQILGVGTTLEQSRSDCIKRIALTTFCYAPICFVYLPLWIAFGLLVLGVCLLLVAVICYGAYLYVTWLLGY